MAAEIAHPRRPSLCVCSAICYFIAIFITNDMVYLSTKNNNGGDKWTGTNIFHFDKNGRFQ